jgi:hypothetical protein
MMIRRDFLKHLTMTAAGLLVAEDVLEELAEPRRKIWPVGVDLSEISEEEIDFHFKVGGSHFVPENAYGRRVHSAQPVKDFMRENYAFDADLRMIREEWMSRIAPVWRPFA